MRVLVTGGAGFIGSHVVRAFASGGAQVCVLDDLSRGASRHRLQHLTAAPIRSRIRLEECDVRDPERVDELVRREQPSVVIHLAGQVAVSTSLAAPDIDFSVNAIGTVNVLEAVRRSAPSARVLVASTNKIYGTLEHLSLRATDTRYELTDLAAGVSEALPPSPRTPYGCSKYVAELYAAEYARSFSLSTAVLRLSCVYGPMQAGEEAQGWVSWFVSSAVADRRLTIYGDGRQVRDLLHVSDLIALIKRLVALDRWPDALVCNVGGGPANAISVWAEFSQLLHTQLGRLPRVEYASPRPDDQLAYVSDTRYVQRLTGWQPKVGLEEGVRGLVDEARFIRTP